MRILIADDHEIVRRGVRSLLSAAPGCEVCGEAVDGADAVQKAQSLKPDLVVMDISMPNLNGLEATRRIAQVLPETRVLILSQHESPEMMRQALKAGAGAYVRKSALYTDLLSAVETLRNGKSSFEPAANEKHSVVHDDQEIQLRSKAFEKELAESEERFRLTFEQAAVGMALVAEDGRLLRVNRKLCDILGYSQDELRDITYQEITHPDDVREDTVRAARVAAGELDQYSIDKRYVRKDGSIVWANLTVGAVRDPDRKLKYFVSVVEDISARKLAEEKLLLAQQELALTAAHREAEAKALARLNEWNSRLLRITNLREGLFSILGAVIEMLGADKGNVQLLDPERNVLTIEAQCGFQPDFLEFFKEVSAKDASACGRALVSGERVVIEDVETDGAYVSFRAIARAAGYRAVISTPLIDVDGKPLGIVSAHFASPHRPTPESLRRLDLYARQAAAFIQRCKAEEALRESEARFRALSAKFENLHAEAELQLSKYHELFTNAPAALCLLTGPDHRFTFVNRECLRMTRRSRIEDLLGKSAREAMPELEPQGYFALLDQVYRSGIAYVGTEMPVALEEHGSGRQQQAFINFTVQPIRNAIGQVEGLLFHGVEVTSQVAARRELESSEQRLRLAQAAGHIGSWEWDPDNQAVLSPELHKMFGTSPDDPDRLQSWLVHVHPDDAARVQQLMREGYQQGEMDYEYRYIHPQDGLRWFHCRGRRMQDERRMFGVIVDVTDRKRAEEALRSGEEAQYQLAAIVASSDDAIISKNLDGIITSWNASAERMFGYTAQEAVGSPITIIIPPELHTFEKEILARLRAGKRIEHYEAPRLRKDGSAIDVSITISPIRDATGRIIGASNVTRDITERKRAEEVMKEREISGRLLQLQDQERRHIARELHDSLGQLAAGISIGIGVIGRERSKLSESAAGSLTEIAQFIDQLSAEIRTISYLLHPPLLDEIGLASALTWYVDGFAERSKVDVDLEIPDDLLRLPQDYELTLFRIVQECLTNIHRHSGSATATVRLSQTRGEIVLEVRDQGRGINPAAQARINAGEAVGVGLRGMRERVRPLGGTMKVESDTTGTSVTVTLPLPTDGDRATAKES